MRNVVAHGPENALFATRLVYRESDWPNALYCVYNIHDSRNLNEREVPGGLNRASSPGLPNSGPSLGQHRLALGELETALSGIPKGKPEFYQICLRRLHWG
jgi:hypothetical protein